MKNITINSKAGYLLAVITGIVFILSACSSDDVAQVISDEFVNISGQIVSADNPAGEEGVTVKGFYSNTSIPSPSTTTRAGGLYAIDVLKNTAVSLQLSKSGFTTLNSDYVAHSADVIDFDTDMPTIADANEVIVAAFPGKTLPSGAWLAINVEDVSGTKIANAVVTVTPTPSEEVYPDCLGADVGSSATIASCVPEREGPMYLAYFTADTVVSVSVNIVTGTQTAPVRVEEVTFLDLVQ